MIIKYSSRAAKQFIKLNKMERLYVKRKVGTLTTGTQGKPLKGHKGLYRIRVGQKRVVYKKTKDKIYIVTVADRKKVYKELDRFLG